MNTIFNFIINELLKRRHKILYEKMFISENDFVIVLIIDLMEILNFIKN